MYVGRNVFIGLRRNIIMSLHKRLKKYEKIDVLCSQPFLEIERFLSNMGFQLSAETINGDKKTYVSVNEKKSYLDVLCTAEGHTIKGEVIESEARQFDKYKK